MDLFVHETVYGSSHGLAMVMSIKVVGLVHRGCVLLMLLLMMAKTKDTCIRTGLRSRSFFRMFLSLQVSSTGFFAKALRIN